MKNARREAAIKREKRKKFIIIAVCVSVGVFITALVVFSLYEQYGTRVFTNGGLAITLRVDGTFTARLAHDTKAGTYFENTVDGVRTISFITDGVTANGSITGKELKIPNEWDDTHGHGVIFRLK